MRRRRPAGTTATEEGMHRFCIDCGVESGAYKPGMVLYTGNDRFFVCKFCGRLQKSWPPACGKDTICAVCWVEKEGVEDTLCTLCKVNRAIGRAEWKKLPEGGVAENAKAADTLGGQPPGRTRSLRDIIRNRTRAVRRALKLREGGGSQQPDETWI